MLLSSHYSLFFDLLVTQLLHPKYSHCFSSEQRQGMYDMVLRVIEALAHPDVAIDEQHWPNQYSRLLRGLLADAKLDSIKRSKTKSESPKTRTSPPVLKQSPARNVPIPLTPSSASSDVHEPYNYTDRPKDGHPAGSPLIDRNHHPQTYALEVPEFFNPPLPFDSDMLQSIRSLTNSWDGMVLPGKWFLNFTAYQNLLSFGDAGINWMGRIRDADTDMKESTIERLYHAGQAQ
jgi:hypothetical protein